LALIVTCAVKNSLAAITVYLPVFAAS